MEYETLETTMQVMDSKVTIQIHYWKVSDKEQFLSNAEKDGYTVERMKSNTKVINIKDFQNQKSKTIWCLTGGKYSN
jgi:hypothetical protein